MFSPEKAVGFVVPLAAWLFAELFPEGGLLTGVPHPHDQALAAKIYEIMPDRRVRFLRDYNFGVSWVSAQVAPIYDLLHMVDDPTSEFEDPDVQTAFDQLKGTLNDVANKLANEGQMISAAGFISMVPDDERATDIWSPETAARVQTMNDRVGELATQISNFYRLLRKKGANLLVEQTKS